MKNNNCTVEEIVNKITKACDLSASDSDMLLHDINNLRGDEWIEVIEESGDAELLKTFKEFINNYDEND